jgi:PAS domain S-box-containing protein
MQASIPVTELERLRHRLATLESRVSELEACLDSVPELVSYVSLHERYGAVNRAYEKMFAVRREDIAASAIEGLLGEPHAGTAHAYLARALSGELVSFESQLRQKDGALRDVSVTYTPHRNGDGQMQGVAVCIRDITAEKGAEAAIREREQVLTSVLRSVPDVIQRYTPDLRVVFASPAVEQHTGAKAEDFAGKTHTELGYPPELAQRLDDGLRHVFATGETERVRFDFSGPEGLRQYEGVATPEFAPDGSVQSVITVTHEITERLRAERELRQSEERQRLAVEAGKVGLWHWDIVRNQVEWSDQIYRLHGLEHGTFDGTVEAFAALVHPDDQERVSSALAEALAKGGDYHVEFRTIRPDGAVIWIFTNGRVIDEGGRPARMLGATIDITESKAAAERLRQANEDLNQFAYSASHDLQEPLRMIALYTQLLKRKYSDQLDEEAIRFIDYSVQGARRMEDLIRDLLAYTQVVDTEAMDASEQVETQLAFDKALSMLHASIDQCGATVTHGFLPAIKWREIYVLQLFQNLIGNALKYRRTDRPPRIHVSAERQGRTWRFAVEDNGIGVERRHHERIFGLFKRLHSTSRYEGTGIGLAICQKIVERHGGRIWIESEPGNGSTFYFTCPVA